MTVSKGMDEEGELQVIAMQMSGEILCSMNLSSTMTFLDFRSAVESTLTLPLRIALNGNIYSKESFFDYYGTNLGSENWDIACKLLPAAHVRYFSLSGQELQDDKVLELMVNIL